ncbi:MAG: methyltransferase domain-containing protein [Candidatus Dormibacteraeota bacterium]|nr:methyltransferase domain-containing protein [Candidatus Dormibacteraeota bacterium]
MSAEPVETPAEYWRASLAAWAIPPAILDAAPESPWQLRPHQFAARADHVLRRGVTTVSQRRALEALPEGGSVLDVGAGAGAASLPLLTRASRLTAVDGDAGMIHELRARVPSNIELTVVEGRWPDAANEVGPADVVVCNHVAYNVPNLDEFVAALTEKARHRVVMEVTAVHPRANQNFLWPIFHGIERPERPVAGDAVAVVRATGVDPRAEEWAGPELLMASDELRDLVAAVRRYLCLGAERDPEIAGALEGHLVRRNGLVGFAPVPRVTIWWDAAGPA